MTFCIWRLKDSIRQLSIATKYLIIESLKFRVWPFTEKDEVNISNFIKRMDPNIDKFLFENEFLNHNGLSLRKQHNKRRGQIRTKLIKEYLKQLIKAVIN